MCGIVGASAERNITAVLVEGLKRLEYRGYDSAGVALLTDHNGRDRRRRVGKVSELEQALSAEPLAGRLRKLSGSSQTPCCPELLKLVLHLVQQRSIAFPTRAHKGNLPSS